MNIPKLYSLPKRLLSIDVFRAVVMFLMIFINDVGSVKSIPLWINHAEANDDAMGFADLIFPAFLFIIGLSIPLAINNRVKQNDTTYEVLSYIILRSAALIVMGFFHVNLDSYGSASLLPKPIWALIVTISFFLIWLNYPKSMNKFIKYRIILTGIFLLLVMAFLYKSDTGAGNVSMQPQWWGILGILGWTYLVCAIIYYFFKNNFYALLICFLLFGSINIAEHNGLLENKLYLIDDASAVTLTFGGLIFSTFYNKQLNKKSTLKFCLILTVSGLTLLLFGFLIRPFTEGISKIRSTPSWIFISMGGTIMFLVIFIYLIDELKNINLFKSIRPAGTSTLTCYLMPYFYVYILQLFHIDIPPILNEGIAGIFRSLIISYLLIWLVGKMERKNLVLKI